MRVAVVHQPHTAPISQRRVVGQDDRLVCQGLDGIQDAVDDRPTANLDERLVDAAEARGAPTAEDQD
jgi:hypothetical protein